MPDIGSGRRRRYCRQSCRQRAYEQRAAVRGTAIPDDATILTADEAAAVSDRAFQVRAGCEDVLTALREGASHAELERMCAELIAQAADAERLR